MKNLKIAFCFLFVTIVSSNVFCQVLEIKSEAFAIGVYDKVAGGCRMKPKYIDNISAYITKDKIKMNDVFNSYFDIIKNDTLSIEGVLFTCYYCRDKDGLFCNFMVGDDKVGNTSFSIGYSDIIYFYYTKN